MKDKLFQYKNKLKILVSLLIVVIVVMIGSYAIFQNFTRQSGTNSLGATSCFSVSFEGVNNALNLNNEYPIPDDEGLEKSPYTFKIINNCDKYLTLSIGVETLSTSEIPASLIKGVIVKSGVSPKNPIILSNGKVMEAQNSGKAYALLEDSLKANESKTYDLRLWFDEAMTKEEGASKTYKGKVIVASSADMEKQRLLNEAILADNDVQTPITTPGAELSAYTLDDVITTSTTSVSGTNQAYYITYGTGWVEKGSGFNLTGASVTTNTYANSYASLVGKYLPDASIVGSGSSTSGAMKQTTNLSSVYYVISATSNSFTYKILSSNKNTTESLLASAEDDYGTSYYFRGSVKNNYVEFANKCWRVVRVGGDSTVKLILHNDNTAKSSNPCASANNNVTAAFAHYNGSTYTSKFNSSYNDNTYVGFMYGTASSSTYNGTHANTNKSTALTNLETWYNNNLKTYESVIDDNIFCNDKSVVTDTSYNPWWTNPSGLGYGTSDTYYKTTQRLVGSDGFAGGTGPSLKCNGNLSKITSKIGLITADELAFAGYVVQKYNSASYLQENSNGWWCSLSPGQFSETAMVWSVNSIGEFTSVVVDNLSGLRPYISLKSSVKVTGEGTSENPYKVV